MTHYIHRPAPEGGETDKRFREITEEYLKTNKILWWDPTVDGWRTYSAFSTIWLGVGTIWRIPGSDAPSVELLALAEEVKNP